MRGSRLAGYLATMAVAASAAAGVTTASRAVAGTEAPSCQLSSPTAAVKHVINLVFDNTHFKRDNPNVPSDLEQMPHLLDFIRSNGTLLTNHHTPLISHTGNDILTQLTGVYGDRHGQPIANSSASFNTDGSVTGYSTFAYWTDPLASFGKATDTTPQMIAETGKIAPAPWVPYTRAGCSVGAAGAANIVLENTGGDINTVFGPGSPEAADPNKFGNYVGVAVHCGAGSTCATDPGAKADLLPDEPGGYAGFKALFGHKNVAPAIGGTGAGGVVLDDVFNGAPPGGTLSQFPGFDGMTAANSLGYVAAMQEHGVPVTYAYVSDSHDAHAGQSTLCPGFSPPSSNCAYGPGEDGYVKALKAQDDAFAAFFARLAADGINPSNTVFNFSSEEDDHFAGTLTPSPEGCDGVTVRCSYNHTVATAPTPGQIGEVAVNAKSLLASQKANTTPFFLHNDSAPNFWVTGNPAQTSPTARQLERDVAGLSITNPYTGATEPVTERLADRTEMSILHMVTADPARTPTFTAFAKPADFVSTFNCPVPNAPPGTAVCSNPQFAWIHGDFQPEITTTWLGMVGPGIRAAGTDSTTFTDHTDIRPTVLALAGLHDDYRSDGRVITEVLTPDGVPQGLRANGARVEALGAVYKQLNASVGQFALDTLAVSTKALASGTPSNDGVYANLEARLAALGTARGSVAVRMSQALNAAAFDGRPIAESDLESMIAQGQNLLAQATALATGVAELPGAASSTTLPTTSTTTAPATTTSTTTGGNPCVQRIQTQRQAVNAQITQSELGRPPESVAVIEQSRALINSTFDRQLAAC